MNTKETLSDVAAAIWDLLTTDPGDRSAAEATAQPPHSPTLDPHQLAAVTAGQAEPGAVAAAIDSVAPPAPAPTLTAEQFDQAVAELAARLEAGQAEQLAQIRTELLGQPDPEPVVRVVRAAAPAPTPEVTNVYNRYIREGDTTVDNRSYVEVYGEGDVEIDQEIINETVIADDGGVAIGGDVDGSAINTGVNKGILAGGDVDLEDSVVGNGNMQLNDSEVGAVSGSGDATNAEGENVNLGSGRLTDVDAEGDADVVSGDHGELSGDTDVDVDSDGPASVAVGDHNAQQTTEDQSSTAEGSYNTDNSTTGSGNTTTTSSGNHVEQDNDMTRTEVDDSFTASSEDNDITTWNERSETSQRSEHTDNDSYGVDQQVDDLFAEIDGDDNTLDFD